MIKRRGIYVTETFIVHDGCRKGIGNGYDLEDVKQIYRK